MELAKANGISRRLTELPLAEAMLTTMGNIRATVPVLLTKEPMSAVPDMTSRKRRVSLFPEFQKPCTYHLCKAGVEYGSADNEQTYHHHDYGIGEAGQGFLCRYHTADSEDKECAQGHYVGPYFSPYKKDGGYKKGGKGDNHVLFYGKVYAKLAI